MDERPIDRTQLEGSATASVASHLENSPVDTLIVVKGGVNVLEYHETMRPATASN